MYTTKKLPLYFLLAIILISLVQAAPVWNTLTNQAINEDAPDHTTVYKNLTLECTDNVTKVFSVDDQSTDFDLYFYGTDLQVENLTQDYTGTETILVYCNGEEAQFVLTVNPVDDIPQFNLPATINIDEDETDFIDLDDYVDDPDTPELDRVYTASGNTNIIVTINPTSNIATFSAPADWYGTEVITFDLTNHHNVTDTISVTFNNVDDPATWAPLNNQVINEDATDGTILYTDLKQYCTDIDSTRNFTVDPQTTFFDAYFEVFDDNLRIENLTPDINSDDIGTVTVYAYCNGIGAQFDVTINPVNDAPIWLPLPTQTFNEDESLLNMSLNLENMVADAENDPITFSVTNNSQIEATIVTDLFGTYLNLTAIDQDFNGNTGIIITANDGTTTTDTVLNISLTPVDDPAVWTAPTSITINEDAADGTVFLANVDNYCTDIDNSSVTVTIDSWENNNYNLTINSNDLEILGLPADYNDAASSEVILDCNGVVHTIDLEITPVNDAPIIIAGYYNGTAINGTITVGEYDTVEIEILASDVDNDPLTYVINNPALSMSMNGNNFTWHTTTADVGTRDITINVTDGTDTDSITISIKVLRALDLQNITVLNPNYPNSTYVNIAEGTNVSRLKPGQTIEIEANIFNSLADELFDATFSAEIVGVATGTTTPLFNLAANDNTTKTATVTIPTSIGVLSTDLKITAQGYTDDGMGGQVLREVSFTFPIDINKEDPREILIANEQVLPDTLTCIKETAFQLDLVNIGFSDETTNNVLTTTIPSLSYSATEHNLTVPSGATNNVLEKNITLTLPSNTAPGTYDVHVEFTYHNGAKTVATSGQIIVGSCTEPTAQTIDEDFSGKLINLSNYYADDYYAPTYTVTSANPTLLTCTITGESLDCTTGADQSGFTTLNLNYTAGTFTGTTNIPVTVMPVNDAPTLNFPTAYTIDEDEQLVINWSAVANDVDDALNTLTVNTTSGTGVVIDTVEVVGNDLLVTTIPNWYGITTVEIIVADPSGANATDSFDLTVNPVNDDAPIITPETPTGTIYMPEDVTISEVIQASFVDPDENPDVTAYWYVNNILMQTTPNVTIDSYTINGLGTAAIIDVRLEVVDNESNTATANWTVIQSLTPMSSLYTSTIFSLPATSLTNVSSFTITNGLTTITFTENQTFNLTQTVDYDRFFNLQTGIAGIDSTRFSTYAGASATITFTGLTYTKEPLLYYNAGYETTGTTECPATICTNKVWDRTTGTYTFETNTFSTFWLAPNTNNVAPEFISEPLDEIREEELYAYDANVYDPEGDTVLFSLTQAPTSAVINSVTGLLTWNPSDEGDYNITIQATDSQGNIATQSFTITVLPENKLEFDDVDYSIKNGEQERSLRSGRTIDVQPGDEITIIGYVENKYRDMDIDDVLVELIIYNIDDNDDLDDEEDFGRVRDDSKESFSFNFDIPLLVDEGDYDATLRVTGVDEELVNHLEEINFTVEVDKEDEAVYIEDLLLPGYSLSCGTDFLVTAELANIGRDDLENAELRISGPVLSREATKTFDLEEEESDDYAVSVSLDDDLSLGTYNLVLQVFADESILAEEQFSININQCGDETATPTYAIDEETDFDLVAPSVAPVISGTQTTKGFKNSFEYYLLLIAGYIVGIALVIFGVAYVNLLAKRNKGIARRKKRARITREAAAKKNLKKNSRVIVVNSKTSPKKKTAKKVVKKPAKKSKRSSTKKK